MRRVPSPRRSNLRGRYAAASLSLSPFHRATHAPQLTAPPFETAFRVRLYLVCLCVGVPPRRHERRGGAGGRGEQAKTGARRERRGGNRQLHAARQRGWGEKRGKRGKRRRSGVSTEGQSGSVKGEGGGETKHLQGARATPGRGQATREGGAEERREGGVEGGTGVRSQA